VYIKFLLIFASIY